MRVRVLLQGDERTVARAVVRLVLLGGDDEVPSELLEVHRQRVATAEGFVHFVVAVEAYVAPDPSAGFHCYNFHKGLLEQQEISVNPKSISSLEKG